jgi:NAD(P)-dependent dehydrogenase (short-subunit alcohol dehydrogenase family)
MSKTIFITGTSSGLGKATAKHFAEQGWNVVATLRSPEKETELTKYPNIRLIKLDVTDTQQVAEAVQEAIDSFGTIDVVVNNAGVGVYGALELAKEKDIDWIFNVNVRGVINVTKAFLPHFRNNKGGKFINISSFMGITTAIPLGSLYNMSKFALEGFSEGLYYELKPFNISLHLIEPGGSSDNNFVKNTVWNTNSEITVYESITDKLKQLFGTTDSRQVDDISTLVKEVNKLDTGESNKFRTVIGKSGNDLMTLRNSVPIEQYLNTIYNSFK